MSQESVCHYSIISFRQIAASLLVILTGQSLWAAGKPTTRLADPDVGVLLLQQAAVSEDGPNALKIEYHIVGIIQQPRRGEQISKDRVIIQTYPFKAEYMEKPKLSPNEFLLSLVKLEGEELRRYESVQLQLAKPDTEIAAALKNEAQGLKDMQPLLAAKSDGEEAVEFPKVVEHIDRPPAVLLIEASRLTQVPLDADATTGLTRGLVTLVLRKPQACMPAYGLIRLLDSTSANFTDDNKREEQNIYVAARLMDGFHELAIDPAADLDSPEILLDDLFDIWLKRPWVLEADSLSDRRARLLTDVQKFEARITDPKKAYQLNRVKELETRLRARFEHPPKDWPN